jgi:hypothetical protein
VKEELAFSVAPARFIKVITAKIQKIIDMFGTNDHS